MESLISRLRMRLLFDGKTTVFSVQRIRVLLVLLPCTSLNQTVT